MLCHVFMFLRGDLFDLAQTYEANIFFVYKDDWILLVCHLTSHCGSGGHGASHDDG